MRIARPVMLALSLVVAALAGSGCTGWLDPAPPGSSQHPAPSADRHGGSGSSSGPNGSGGPGTSGLDCSGPTPPGEMPFRRLTSTEFNNSVEDLFPKLSFSTFDIPGDEMAGPFEVNTSSGVGTHVSKRYRDAAETISKKFVSNLGKATGCGGGGSGTEVFRDEAENIQASVGQASGEFWNLWANGSLTATVDLSKQGTYRIAVTAAGQKAAGTAPNMEFVVDGATVGSTKVPAPQSSPKTYETETTISSGSHQIGVRFTNDYNDPQTGEDRNLLIDELAVVSTGASASGSGQCLQTYVVEFAERAWRRPLRKGEKKRLADLYQKGVNKYDSRMGLRMVVEAVLQSPNFLYRLGVGESNNARNGAVPLDDFELASRLSYFLWDTKPDATLMEAAKNEELSTRSGLEKQARRMIQDPKARRALNRAVLAMFGLRSFETNEEEAGDLDESTRAAMKKETLAFIDHVLWEGDGRIETLLTARYTFATQETAKLYGESVPSGSGVHKIPFDSSDPRAGILTQPAVLARYGSGAKTVHRGLFVLENLLCSGPPPPPEKLMNPPKRKESESARSQARDRMNHQQCGTCHSQIDPIGLTFDPFGRKGKFRETDSHGNRLRSNGEVTVFDEIKGKVGGPKALAKRLGTSERVQTCFARQWMKRALGRAPSDEEACSLKTLRTALENSDGSLREMFVQIVLTDAFRYRRAASQ